MDEIEWKWQVANQEAHGLLAKALHQQFGSPLIIPQCNRFFDTAEQTLRQLKMSVRLRRNGNQLVITAKRQRSMKDGLHRQWEWERTINNCCWQCTGDNPAFSLTAIAPLPGEVRDIIGNQDLLCFGGFDNERHEWHHQDLHIALDKTSFSPERTDYELEVEIPEESDHPQCQSAWWLDFAKSYGITLTAQPLTKLQRFVTQRIQTAKSKQIIARNSKHAHANSLNNNQALFY